MQLIVTRPRAQALAAVQELRAAGIAAVALPLIGIEPFTDEPTDAAAREALRRGWATLAERRLVMFVSANAVTHFFAAATAGVVWPAQTLAGSTGPGTTAALRDAGVPADRVREPGPGATRLDSEALWQQLRHLPWQGASVLVVRGEGGRDWLADTLRSAGAQVDFLAAYRRTLPLPGADEAALLAAAEARPEAFVWHFSSSEAVLNLPRLAPGRGWRASRAFATHERIGAAARSIGFMDVQVLAPGLQALLSAWSARGGAAQPEDGASGVASGVVPGGASIQSRPL